MDPIFSALVMARWLHFCLMFALFGGAFFWSYMPATGTADLVQIRSFGRRVLRIAAPLAFVTGVGWVALTVANMTGGLDGLADVQTLRAFFFDTTFGPIELARVALLAVLVLLAFLPMRESLRFASVALASGALLVSQAWLGHAAEGGDTLRGAAMVSAYAVHVLAAAAWLGGLPPLIVLVAALRRQAAAGSAILRQLLRYSVMATLAVGLIIATGIANASFRVAGHLTALWPTPYGTVLLVKVGLVVVMLVCAAYNRFIAMPQLDAGSDDTSVVRLIGASIAFEMAIGVLVLAAAAVLGITPPPDVQ